MARPTFSLLLALATITSTSLITSATFDEPPASPCEDCLVQVFDLALIRTQAHAGLVVLTVGMHTFQLEVQAAPWSSDTPLDLLGDEGQIVGRVDIAPETFVGTIVGQPESVVLLGVSTVGLDGFIHQEDGAWVDLQPLRFTDPAARAGETLVDAFHVPPRNDAPASDASAASASSFYPSLLKWADSNFYVASGSGDNMWAKMKAVFDRMNVLMNNDVGFFYFDGGSVACTTTACDAAWGMGSSDSDTLLREFAWSVYNDRANRPYDAAFLYTYKNIGVSGTSSEPGRYSLVRMRDNGWQHSWSSTYEAALVMMHELGHNWGGDHRFYTSWDEYRQTCSIISSPVCVIEGQEFVATHYSIMCTSCKHEPSQQSIWEPEFSTSNRNRVLTCNGGSWQNGEFEPWTQFENPYMAMGSDCKNPNQ